MSNITLLSNGVAKYNLKVFNYVVVCYEIATNETTFIPKSRYEAFLEGCKLWYDDVTIVKNDNTWNAPRA